MSNEKKRRTKKQRLSERMQANPPVLDFTPGEWALCPWRPKRLNPFTKEWF